MRTEAETERIKVAIDRLDRLAPLRFFKIRLIDFFKEKRMDAEAKEKAVSTDVDPLLRQDNPLHDIYLRNEELKTIVESGKKRLWEEQQLFQQMIRRQREKLESFQRTVQEQTTELATLRGEKQSLREMILNQDKQMQRLEAAPTNREQEIKELRETRTSQQLEIDHLKKNGNEIQARTIRELIQATRKQEQEIEKLKGRLPNEPFWVGMCPGTEVRGPRHAVFGPDEATWFGPEIESAPEVALGLCHTICDLLNRAWEHAQQVQSV